MLDKYGRDISYLRVSVTDRCNLRCRYCMPAEGGDTIAHHRILSYEEIAAFIRVAVGKGIRKVRITGGEPLVRKAIVSLVHMIRLIKGIEDLGMTTNATRLAMYAEQLKKAGLDRINISLDSVDPERYREITRGGDLEMALAGIEAARVAGLAPIKLNCVVKASRDEQDAVAVAQFAGERNLEVRYIREMNIASGHFTIVDGGAGGDCRRCNRLRLSADGYLRPCLFNDTRISIREHGYGDAIRLAVESKPESGTYSQSNQMHHIGG